MTKRRRRTHHAHVIRADLTLVPDPLADLGESAFPRRCGGARASEPDLGESPRNGKPFRRPRRSRPGRGRAEGQGRAIRCSSPAPGSPCSTPSCAPIRPPPGRCAPASRFRAPRPPPRSSASTPTKARCATCASPSATLGPAAKLLQAVARSRRPAAQPRPRPDRRRGGAARPGPCRPERPRGQPEGLRRGGRSGLSGRQGRRPGVLRLPGRPSGRSRNPRPLGVRPRPSPSGCAGPRPVPLIATKILDPTLRSPGAGRRPRPGDPAWPNAAAGAIALAAASALDLAADLSRRAETLIAVAPKLRAETGGRKSSTCCSPKIASRPPRRPATRR